MYAVPSCLVAMNRQAVSDKIVFVFLHFIAYSHIICSIRRLMFLVKVENVKIFYFYVPLGLCKSALSNTEKSGVQANATLIYFEHCASLHKCLCRQPNKGKLRCTSLDTG